MRLIVLVFGACLFLSSTLLAAPNIVIMDSQNATVDSEVVIRRFALGNFPEQATNRYYGLSDEGLYSQKTWDTYVYGTQGSLIAKKLLAFGSVEDIRYVRNAILTAPVQQSDGYGGIVDSTPQARGHLALKYTIESNLELVIMARDYLAHSGDTGVFHAPIARVLCYRNAIDELISLHRMFWQGFDCTGAPNQNQTVTFVERTHDSITNEGFVANPARALGQLFLTYEPFRALRFGMQAVLNDAWIEPIRILVVRNSAPAQTLYDQVIECPSSDPSVQCPATNGGWLEIEFNTPLPSGEYNVEIHPLTSSDPVNSFWRSLGWWTEVDTGSHGGATTKLYPAGDPFSGGAKAWTMAEKIEFAMNWALVQSIRNNQLGVFVSPEVMNRGTTEDSTYASTYYDNFKSGHMDSYVNMLYLKALVAYDELVTAGVVRQQFTTADITTVAQAITDVFTAHTGGNGALMSWIDALGNDRWLGLLVPHAIAATLPMPEAGKIRDVFDVLRDQSRIKPGFFRTNVVRMEDVSPLLWDAHHEWKYFEVVNGIQGFAACVFKQRGDWHIFGSGICNGIGRGNYGLQENNGGVLLSTTGYTFAAGPYPEMLQDYRGLVAALDRIGDAVKDGEFNAYADPDARTPITEPLIFEFCVKAWGKDENGELKGQYKDSQGAMRCGFYKDISYNLPEGGVFPATFVDGLLNLRIAPDGSATFYGQSLTSTSNTAQITARFPPEIVSVQISDYNIRGVPRSITCSRSGNNLTCQMVP